MWCSSWLWNFNGTGHSCLYESHSDSLPGEEWFPGPGHHAHVTPFLMWDGLWSRLRHQTSVSRLCRPASPLPFIRKNNEIVHQSHANSTWNPPVAGEGNTDVYCICHALIGQWDSTVSVWIICTHILHIYFMGKQSVQIPCLLWLLKTLHRKADSLNSSLTLF